MNTKKIDSLLPLLAALVVLFSSLWKPETTLIISVACLIGLSIYTFFKKSV